MTEHPADRLAAVIRAVTDPSREHDPFGSVAVQPVGRSGRVIDVRLPGHHVALVVGPDGDTALQVDGVPLTELDTSDDPDRFVRETLVPLVDALAAGQVNVSRRLDHAGRVAGADLTFEGDVPAGLEAHHRHRALPGARRQAVVEDTTVMTVDGVDVRVRRRPGGSTFDVTVPAGAHGPSGFTLTFFPERGSVDEATLREEIARNVEGLATSERDPGTS
jgi:hypothetical protein